MKNLWTIIKKELTRVFKDTRLVLSTILLPGLLIFVIYSFMGDAITNVSNPLENSTANIAVVNREGNETFTDACDALFKSNYIDFNESEIDTKKTELLKGDIDYIIVFPEDFTTKVENKLSPHVDTYYNPSEDVSSSVNDYVTAVFTQLETQYDTILYPHSAVFTTNIGTDESKVFEENKLLGKGLSYLLPFLIITFLFSGAMSIGPETIAGEKERGTMATLLVTPTPRKSIALGKIISLAIVCICSALSSFLGIIASLPKMLGMETSALAIYGPLEYLAILFVLITTVLVIIGVISVVSAYAKNVKEASVYVVPIYILSMIIGISSMFTTAGVSSPFLYLIPIFNSVNVLTGIFSFNFSVVNFIITIVSNSIYAIVLVFILTKMFNSERMMFSK